MREDAVKTCIDGNIGHAYQLLNDDYASDVPALTRANVATGYLQKIAVRTLFWTCPSPRHRLLIDLVDVNMCFAEMKVIMIVCTLFWISPPHHQ